MERTEANDQECPTSTKVEHDVLDTEPEKDVGVDTAETEYLGVESTVELVEKSDKEVKTGLNKEGGTESSPRSRRGRRASGDRKSHGWRQSQSRRKRSARTSTPTTGSMDALPTTSGLVGVSHENKVMSSMATNLSSWFKLEPEDEGYVELEDDVTNLDGDVIRQRQNGVEYSAVNHEIPDLGLFTIKCEIPDTTESEVENFTAETGSSVIRIKSEPKPDDDQILNASEHDTAHELSLSAGPKQCQNCSKRVQNEKVFKFHSRLLELHGTCSNCDECGATFHCQKTLNADRETHAGDADYFCRICNEQFHFHTAREMDGHMKTHGVGPFSCSFCKKARSSRSRLVKHMESHSDQKNLKRHEVTHTYKSYLCAQCGRKFNSRNSLKYHEKTHLVPKSLCTICGKEFKTLLLLKYHERRSYCNRESKQNMCAYCGKYLTSGYLLKIHERLHTGEKPFTCDVCEKTFTSRKVMQRHKKEVHEGLGYKLTGAIRCECPVCGKVIRKDGLKSHLQTHEKNPKFKCEHCERGFRTRANLRQHVGIHTGEKPYQCKLCGMKFRVEVYLRMHVETHQNSSDREKVHKCPTCDNRYMYSAGVRTHRRLTGCGGKKSKRATTDGPIRKF